MIGRTSYTLHPTGHHVLFIVVLILFAIYILKRRTSLKQTANPPSVGTLNLLLKQWAKLRLIFKFPALLMEADTKYLSSQIPCFVPDFVFDRPLILPPSYREWMLKQSDCTLDRHTIQRELVLPTDLMWHSKTPFDPSYLHGSAFQKFLSSCIAGSQEQVLAEIEDELYGVLNNDTHGWKSVKIYNTVESVMDRVAWRFIVEQPLCGRKDLIRYGKPIFLVALAFSLTIRCFPRFLKPAILLIFSLPEKFLYRRIKLVLATTIRLRMDQLSQGLVEPPHDFLTWAIKRERDTSTNQTIDDEMIDKVCSMSIYLVFAITHGPSAVLSQTLLCLLNSPHRQEYMTKLVPEATEASQQIQDANFSRPRSAWSLGSKPMLPMLDSTLRETMRLYPTSAIQPVWKVAKETTLSSEIQPFILQKGTTIGLPAITVHMDEKLYHNGKIFDPFRFVAQQESLTAADDKFLSWGTGRTACPGRQYASQIMKLVLVALLSRYELRSGNGRDAGMSTGAGRWFGSLFIPDWNAKMVCRGIA